MYTFLTILILLISVFLVLIVLVQNSKGGGLASGFASSNQVLGVRRTTDFLEKATWTAAGALVALCIIITAFIGPKEQSGSGSEVLDNVSAPIAPNMPAPGFGTNAVPGTETETETSSENAQPAEQLPAEQQ
ncbi:MAG: preprotein translocase subunit SecG [Tannerella sp.]|jgi:preprotein translocase subunit SecG|nr:preprotein translocase subunit SecG [Tannerella sp.]